MLSAAQNRSRLPASFRTRSRSGPAIIRSSSSLEHGRIHRRRDAVRHGSRPSGAAGCLHRVWPVCPGRPRTAPCDCSCGFPRGPGMTTIPTLATAVSTRRMLSSPSPTSIDAIEYIRLQSGRTFVSRQSPDNCGLRLLAGRPAGHARRSLNSWAAFGYGLAGIRLSFGVIVSSGIESAPILWGRNSGCGYCTHSSIILHGGAAESMTQSARGGQITARRLIQLAVGLLQVPVWATNQPDWNAAGGGVVLSIQEQFGQIDIYVFDQILRGNIAHECACSTPDAVWTQPCARCCARGANLSVDQDAAALTCAPAFRLLHNRLARGKLPGRAA